MFKHALAGNGFFSNFTGPRLTVARVEAGELDELFSVIGPARPNGEHIGVTTLHSDIGCDSYAKAIPAHAGDGVNELKCECPEEEKLVAQRNHKWWKKKALGKFSGFFDHNDYPKANFRKVMHIHVLDSIIARYKRVMFVWAFTFGLAWSFYDTPPSGARKSFRLLRTPRDQPLVGHVLGRPGEDELYEL